MRSSCWQARWRTWRLGLRQRNVEGQGEGQRGVVSGGRGAGGARGTEKSGAGQLELGKTASEGGGVGRREKQREEGLEVDDGDLAAIFQKCRDSTVKPKQLSNHSLNENVPKRKSVELSKIYNFALRFSFKRVKDLNLI
jgi:hypothetical protein